MRFPKIALLILALFLSPWSSQGQDTKLIDQNVISDYAYVSVLGRIFSKKLTVVVDFGDEPDQIAMGEEFSAVLNKRTSFASILNYMADHGYELVEALDVVNMFNGHGGSQGVQLIFKMKV